MRHMLVGIALGLSALAAAYGAEPVKGAGSTFAANLYTTWSEHLAKAQGGAALEYEANGSSAGVKRVVEHQVDFGASDRPLTREELDANGLWQFPSAIGGVVILTNLPGIPADRIRMDGAVLSAIFGGTLKRWNDPRLVALNPDIKLPDMPMSVHYRGDGSGTSFALTSYLAKNGPEFKKGPTSNVEVSGGHPVRSGGEMVRAIKSTVGAIGYADYSNAVELSLPSVQLKNKWGGWVLATPEAIQQTVGALDWVRLQVDQDPTFAFDLTDTGCPHCWPIATGTYVLVPCRGKSANAWRVLDFFEQALQLSDQIAVSKGYVPLPSRAKSQVGVSFHRWYAALDRAGVGRPQRRAGSADVLKLSALER